MDDRTTKRDLVLAPTEYAYMQDVTKGIVKTYTGPTVINPTAQERPVVFDAEKKLFEPCALEAAVQQIAIAPEGFYVILKNPSGSSLSRSTTKASRSCSATRSTRPSSPTSWCSARPAGSS